MQAQLSSGDTPGDGNLTIAQLLDKWKQNALPARDLSANSDRRRAAVKRDRARRTDRLIHRFGERSSTTCGAFSARRGRRSALARFGARVRIGSRMSTRTRIDWQIWCAACRSALNPVPGQPVRTDVGCVRYPSPSWQTSLVRRARGPRRRQPRRPNAARTRRVWESRRSAVAPIHSSSRPAKPSGIQRGTSTALGAIASMPIAANAMRPSNSGD